MHGHAATLPFWLTRLKPCAKVTVMATRTPPDYDASKFPPFAVTVDIVILTMAGSVLHVLLVKRGEEPFKDMWAIPGGFKRPDETLDDAARRELSEETGVDVPTLLTQFGAYGDPGRDPHHGQRADHGRVPRRAARRRRDRRRHRRSGRQAHSRLGHPRRENRARVRPRADRP